MAALFDTCHPVYYRLHELGKTVDQGEILNTFYTYMELCEVKRLWDVNYHFNESLNLLYLTARKRRTSDPEIYVSFSVIQTISLEDIEKIQEGLQTQSLILVFKEGDSSSVYYKVSNSLVKPSTPEESKKVRLKDERKYELEKEIKRNTSNLFEMAKTLGKTDDMPQDDTAQGISGNNPIESNNLIESNDPEKLEETFNT